MQTKGFTLVEVLITVAIVAILAAIAYPAYQNQVIKTRRSAAKACLLELAQYMERYYTTNMSYENAVLPDTECQTELEDFYTFALDGNPTATSFTISAAAQGAQANDNACSPLRITETGTKTPAACW